MEYVKPNSLSLTTRCFSAAGKNVLSIAVICGFELEAPDRLLEEDSLWEAAAGALSRDQLFDHGLPKPLGEVMVAGRCFVPNDRTAPGYEASFRVGEIHKSVYVFGPRYWESPVYSIEVISKPEPFTRVDISWENAFGGPDFDGNPIGKGLAETTNKNGKICYPLPNIEDPAMLIALRSDRPEPAGFSAQGLDWPSKLKNLGTFDRKWFQNHWPGFPQDFDFTYFNLAPKDQRLDGYFWGDESIEVKAMHPEKAVIQSRLPGLRARVFADSKTEEGERFQEIKTSLETVWLFPHLNIGAVIWRGTTLIEDDEAEDVTHLLAFHESLDEEPKAGSYYEAMMRRTPEEEPLEELEAVVAIEPDLPPPAPESPPVAAAQPAQTDEEARLAQVLGPIQAAIKETEAKLDAEMRSLGIDPEKIPLGPKMEEVLPGLESMILDTPPDLGPEDMIKHVSAQSDALEGRLLKYLENLGLDPSVEPVEVEQPSLSIKDVIKILESPSGEHQELIDMISGLDNELKQSRDSIASILAEAVTEESEAEPEAGAESTPKASVLTREEIIEGYSQGRSFSGSDLTGLDLSECYLEGIDLSGAILENVNLSKTDLSKALLDGAVLTGAEMSGAKLNAASLQSVSAEKVSLGGAKLQQANLTRANLTAADLRSTNLKHAIAAEADFSEALLNKADCYALQGRGCILRNADLSEANLNEADLTDADLSEAVLSQADFTKAIAVNASFAEVAGERAVFEGADLRRSKADGQTSFKNGKFGSVDLSKAYYEDADFSGVDFKKAKLNGASLTRCNLTGADFHLAEARESNFSKSNLEQADLRLVNMFNGSLRNARLIETDLRGSNLSGVDFYKSVQHEADFRGANINRTVLSAWREND